jgi:hypothetical protein
MTEGMELILKERERQIQEEGWTPEHDDEHKNNELVLAAVSYLQFDRLLGKHISSIIDFSKKKPMREWPWADEWWKPSDDPIRNLEKAGALIAAEIDRRKRLGW